MKIDYTEIRNKAIRGKICKLMSEMLDNPDEHGIFPTSEFMWKMESFILPLHDLLQEYIDKYNECFDLNLNRRFAKAVKQAIKDLDKE